MVKRNNNIIITLTINKVGDNLKDGRVKHVKKETTASSYLAHNEFFQGGVCTTLRTPL